MLCSRQTHAISKRAHEHAISIIGKWFRILSLDNAVIVMEEYIERAILARSLLDYKAYKDVLSDEGRAALQVVDVSESGMKCPITHCDLEVGSKAVRLPCQHIFDEEAILQWLENEKAECPVCRQPMPSKKVPIGIGNGTWVDDEERMLAMEREALIRNVERTAWLDLTRAFFPPTRLAHEDADTHPFGMRDMNEQQENVEILREIMSPSLVNPFDPRQI